MKVVVAKYVFLSHFSSHYLFSLLQVNFTFTEDVSDELYVYYRLSNFYQNHRRYVASYSIAQLQGQNLNEGGVSLFCNPLLKNGSLLLNPCGLVANSFFNGLISFSIIKCNILQ